jgi:protein-S-isoprenylcysteine O-methyltransferase Ste14
VVAKMWQEVTMRREAEKTIRLAIERGQPLSPALVDRLLRPKKNYGAMHSGAVLVAVGVGLPIMGYFIGLGGDTDAMYPMMGAGALVFLIGIALLTVWWFTRRDRSSVDMDSLPQA